MAINLKAISSIVNIATPVFSGMKKWVFSDGKFNIKRALVLILAACLTFASVQYVGVEQTQEIVEIVDDVSDIIGYEE